MGVFNKDLTETLFGHLVFHWILPAISIGHGATGIYRQSITVRGAPVESVPAILYGTGFLLVGLAVTGMPSLEKIRADGFDLWMKIRLVLAFVAAGLFLSGALRGS